jgi:hypothetical protein
MLLPIKQEHRDILADLEKRGQLRGIVRSVPDGTAPHIVARLTAGLEALCESRSVSEAADQCYQVIAERRAYQSYVRLRRRAQPSDQTDVLAQITRFNATHRNKRETVADVRAIAATFPGAPLEEIARWKRSGYSTDVCNALLLAQVTRQVRGWAFGDNGAVGANSPRDAWTGGQSNDPTCSLRDDDDFWKNLFGGDYDPDAYDDDSQRHQRAAEHHRACARTASTMAVGAAHYGAADKHDRAARQYPDVDASKAARAASISLKDIS